MKKLFTFLLLLVPATVKAQDYFGRNKLTNGGVGNSLVLKDRSLEHTIARIINIVLGFLGVLATVAIIYGGFKMMTSQGNAEQTGDAKKIIIAGVIGLVIVLASVAIANFVIGNLAEATGN